MKRTQRKLKKGGSRPIRQNRVAFRKKVVGHRDSGHSYQKPIKIKGKEYEKTINIRMRKRD